MNKLEAERVKAKLCVRCGKPAAFLSTRCQEHIDSHNKAQRGRNFERKKAKRAKYSITKYWEDKAKLKN